MSFNNSIRKFILEKLLTDGTRQNLDDKDSLIENNIIDSLGIQNLILFLEKEFDIKVLDEDVIPENFENIDAICTFIQSKGKTNASQVSN